MRVITALGATLALLGAMVMVAPEAAAHTAVGGGSVVCDVETGEYVLTWTITNPVASWNAATIVRTAKSMVIDDTDPAVSFDTTVLARGESATATMVLPGATTGVQSLEVDVHFAWRYHLSPLVHTDNYLTATLLSESLAGDCEIPQRYYEVTAGKHWNFGGADPVAGGSATIRVTAGELSKTWVIDTLGNYIGDDTPLLVPAEVSYEVTEVAIVNPEGWVCEEDENFVPFRDGDLPLRPQLAFVANACEPAIPITFPEPTTTTTTTTTTTPETIEPADVGGVVEEPPVDEGVLAGGAEAPAELPRTGVGVGVGAVMAVLMLGLGEGLRRTGRRQR
jgi:hypothetical protein